jgi:phage tail sheath protein FI
MEVIVRSDGETEVYSGLNLDEASTDHIVRRFSKSEIVTVEAEVSKEILPPVQVLFGEGETKGTVTFAGGFDGTIESVDPGVFMGNDGGPGNRSGIEAFKENNLVSLIAVPGITFPEVIVSLVSHCENEKNRFAILDVPLDTTKTGDIAKYRELIDSSYAAIYHPWLQVYDRASQKAVFVPPSGSVAGVFSRTDIQRGVHKAPANEPILATALSSNYSTKEQDVLNPIGVNLIRQLPGQGIRVWGARTASSDSNFKYVNVRRLFIYVEESIRNSTNWVVFEPNTSDLWSRVRLTITSFLEGLFRSGMLAGEGSSEAYFVDLGPTTMSRDDIMNGRLICNIGIAPVRPAEFVIFRITQFTAEAEAAAE